MEQYHAVVSRLNVWRLCLALNIILFVVCPIFFFLGIMSDRLFTLIWLMNACTACLCWYLVDRYHKLAERIFQKIYGHKRN